MKMKLKIISIVLASLIIATTAIVIAKADMGKPHECSYEAVSINANCVSPDMIKYVCSSCKNVYFEDNGGSPKGHNFGEWVETISPYCGKNGLEFRSCITCGYDEFREVVCEHVNVTETIVKKAYKGKSGIKSLKCDRCFFTEQVEYECIHENTTDRTTLKPSCTTQGLAETICKDCESILKEYTIKEYGHSIKNETVVTKPTPLSKGVSDGTCTTCNQYVRVDTVWKPKWNNTIYIPTAKVEAELYEGKCDQATVDAHDVVINFTRINKNEPLILGHDYGSLGKMYKAKNGDYIYVVHNGALKVYKIKSSEMGMKWNNNYDIVAVDDIESIFTPYNKEMIHLYTCYGAYNWLIWAERDFDAEKKLVSEYTLGEKN